MKYYLGLDLGGTNMAAGVVDEKFNIIKQKSIPTHANRPIEEVIFDMVEVSIATIKDAGLKLSDFTSWGIGMPSYVNPKTGLLVHANNLGWKNVPIYEYLKKHIDLPIYIENDANCATLGEAIVGAGADCDNIIMLTLGTGVGGGIILNKKIFSGSDMMGVELGHTKLVYNGMLCTCGQKGCLESYCSAIALIREIKKSITQNPHCIMGKMCNGDLSKVSVQMVFEAAKNGDKEAKAIIEQYISYLAGGISTFITIFRPEKVIIGGGISNVGNDLIIPLNEKIYGNTFAAHEIGVPKAIKAQLGNDAGIIGAALLEKFT